MSSHQKLKIPSENDSESPPSNHPQASKSSTKPLRHFHEADFQKNYPKNIFIPLIEYLTELGYKEAFQNCVGCRSQVEGKNVVSLSSIYLLTTQDWFLRNINKQLALSHISNKILLNSKIKKKLFHLLIAHLILLQHFHDVKDFKRKVSKQANIISKKHHSNDEIFTYPNAIIYLLHLFLKILLFHANKKGYNKLEEQFSKMSLEQSPSPDSKVKNGSKEEYKFYVKEIVHLFAGKSLGVQNSGEILEEVKQSIMEKDKLFRQKYKLVEGIPNWLHFVDCVVIRCFQHKKKDHKLTNFLFNDWINECKNKMLSIIQAKNISAPPSQPQKKVDNIEWINNKLHFNQNWSALPLPLIPSQTPQQGQAQKEQKVSKQFSPIIISSSKL